VTPMNINDLTFGSIALLARLPSTSSIRVLAQSLRIEASTVSRNIKALEETLGVRLVNRSSRGITPTAEGKILGQKAAEICEALRELKTQPNSALRPYKQFLNLGSRGFVNTFIAPILCKGLLSSTANHDLGLRFIDMSPQESIQAAKVSAVDMLVVFEKLNLGNAWETFEVGQIEWGLFASKENPIVNSGSKVDLMATRVGHHCSFDGHNLVLNDGLLYDTKGCRQYGHGAQSAQTALAIASATDQLACVPKIVALTLARHSSVIEVPVEDLAIFTTVYLCINKERVNQLIFRRVDSILKQAFG
jgi:DNA-binding transcriptional LysR family regulator